MRALIFAAAALIAVCPAHAAEPAQYGRSTMSVDGALLDLAAFDMNADGLKDIVTVSLTGESPENFRRVAAVFYQKKTGGFAAKPDAALPMDDDASVFDLGAITPDGKGSVCFLAPDGMYAYQPSGSGYSQKPVRLIKQDNIFTGRDPADLPHLKFMAENPDGDTMALLPGMDNLRVYELRDGAFSRTSAPGLPVETTFTGGHRVGADSSLTVSHRMPVVEIAGFDKPDASDIIMSWDDNAMVYLRGRYGRYTADADVTFMPGLLGKPDKDPLEGAWLLPADIDGDGRLDFAVTKKTGGIAQTRSLIFIYLRAADGKFPKKPAHTIITEGVVGPRFVDLDNDGRLDVLLPSIKVGISNFVNMLTSGTVNVEIDLYMQDKSGEFPDRPTKTKSVGFKLDLGNIMKAAPVLETGRFSKSGGYGLAVVSDDDTVSVYLPDRYSILSDRPGMEFEVDAPTEMAVEDLNGDGVDDLVMTYIKSGSRTGTLNVFMSGEN